MNSGGLVSRNLRVVQIAEVVAFLCFLTLTFLLGCVRNRDSDIWWHLLAGRDMLRSSGIPRVDSYTWGSAGAPWIDLHWGFQIPAAWIYQSGGFPAITLATASIAAVALAVALWAARIEGFPALTLLCWLPPLVVMSGRFYPRPEIITLFFLATTLGVLHRTRVRPRWIWALVPLMLLWVNVQGLFALGLVLLAFRLADSIWSRSENDQGLRQKHLLGELAAVAVCFVNPYGWKGFIFPIELFKKMSSDSQFYASYIGELREVSSYLALGGYTNPYAAVLMFVLIASAGSFFLPVRHKGWLFRLLSFTTFAWLGLKATRNAPQFAMVCGAVGIWNLSDWLATRRPASLRFRAGAAAAMSVLLVAASAWVVTGGFYAFAGEGRQFGLEEHPFHHAHDAALFLRNTDSIRYILAYHEGQSAVVEFHKREDQKVYVDPRLEVTSRELLQRYQSLAVAIATDSSSWRQTLASMPQPLAILVDHASHGSLEKTLSGAPDWKCIYRDRVAAVYVPAGSPLKEVLRQQSCQRAPDELAGCFRSRYQNARAMKPTIASVEGSGSSVPCTVRDPMLAGAAGS